MMEQIKDQPLAPHASGPARAAGSRSASRRRPIVAGFARRPDLPGRWDANPRLISPVMQRLESPRRSVSVALLRPAPLGPIGRGRGSDAVPGPASFGPWGARGPPRLVKRGPSSCSQPSWQMARERAGQDACVCISFHISIPVWNVGNPCEFRESLSSLQAKIPAASFSFASLAKVAGSSDTPWEPSEFNP